MAKPADMGGRPAPPPDPATSAASSDAPAASSTDPVPTDPIMGAADAQPADPPDLAPPPPPKVAWRTVALCMRGCKVFFGDALAVIHGGEWITDAQRAKIVAHDHHFKMFDVESPKHLEHLMESHADEIKHVIALAEEVGYEAHPHGFMRPPKDRSLLWTPR